ncbi:MAG: DNA repair protein RecN [Acidobacteria bacterium]|nr:MAG: DNA repair protein RecN [Acidobacteriota bacterium]
MLKFLSVENFALIDRLEIEFSKGLNLITGETGSGKSILVDAVGLLVGRRASLEMVRQGFEQARVEGMFELSGEHPARVFLADAGIPLEGGELIIRRNISRSGSNKIFINGVLSPLATLSQLGTFLADIHGQHEQQLLLRSSVQLQFLDAFSAHEPLTQQVRESFHLLQGVRSELERLQASEQERLQRLDTLHFQIADIDKLQLRAGLDVELEAERGLLASAEKRLSASQRAYQDIYEREESSLSLLHQAKKELEELCELDPQLEPVMVKLSDSRYLLEEVAYQLRDYTNQIESNPGRLDAVQESLSEIQKARRKYGETVDEILAYLEKAQKEVLELSQCEAEIEQLAKKESQLESKYRALAQHLSRGRHQQAKLLSRQVERELTDLHMGNAAFTVQVNTSDEKVTEQGMDQVEFLISANVGESSKPLAKIASGGELSRTVLALKSILTLEDYPKTLVFDEVDAGIGGRVASTIGEKLARLGTAHQVFCVTHLPQVASYASQHFHVTKRPSAERTIVEIVPLEQKARVEEISRMMAGKALTDTTRKQARELLRRGKDFVTS